MGSGAFQGVIRMKDFNVPKAWACPQCGHRMSVNVEDENVYASKKQMGFSITVVCPQCGHEERLYKLSMEDGLEVKEG